MSFSFGQVFKLTSPPITRLVCGKPPYDLFYEILVGITALSGFLRSVWVDGSFFEQVAQKCRDGGTSDRMNSTSARSPVPVARHMFASAQLTACVERNSTRCIARRKISKQSTDKRG